MSDEKKNKGRNSEDFKKHKDFFNDIKHYLHLCGEVIQSSKGKGSFETQINRKVLLNLMNHYDGYLLGIELIHQIAVKICSDHLPLEQSQNYTFLPAGIRNLTIFEVKNSYFSKGFVEKYSSEFFKVKIQIQNKMKNLTLSKGLVIIRMFKKNEFKKH